MVSAVVLTHNDEYFLARTLKSLSWCDERIVVDDYSTDKTQLVAQKEKAIVFTRHLQGDFSGQRNFGLSKATSDWVLFVDSDEVVSEYLQREILTSVSGLEYSGYRLKRRDFLFGRFLDHGETGKVELVRLGKKDAGHWTRPVHEIWDIQGPIGILEHSLEHFPHQTVGQFLIEVNNYSSLNAAYLFRQRQSVSVWHIVFYPAAKFFIDYIWYRGFLDGMPGAVVALMMSFHSFLTRAKLYFLEQKDLKA